MERVDVVINGGGMVGLALASLLVQENFSVAVIESHKPRYSDAITARVSAINQASIKMLQQINVWSHLQSKASLQRLVVWDDLGGGEVHFDAAESGLHKLGFIVENKEIVKHLAANKQIHFFYGERLCQLTVNENEVLAELESGKKISASLCVGADGANSWVREKIGVEIKKRPYHHKAIIAVVEIEKPHQQTGWQNFLTSGPLALLPLKNSHHCAIVWSNIDKRAEALMQMDELEFECELNNAFGSRLGFIRYLADRRVFPLIMRHARHYVQPRVALVGDAAHTIHPLAGQGVNLGFSDVVKLSNSIIMAKQNRQDIGGLRTLRKYERERKSKNTEMILAMRGFYELFSATNSSIVQLRSQGFNFVDRCGWLKQFFMSAATT